MVGGAVLVVTGLVWLFEAVAFWLGWWPTITGFVRPHRDVAAVFTIGCVAIQLTALWTMLHLFGSEGW